MKGGTFLTKGSAFVVGIIIGFLFYAAVVNG